MALTLQSLMIRLPGKCVIITVVIVVCGQTTSRLSTVDSIMSTNLALLLDVLQDTVDQITEPDCITSTLGVFTLFVLDFRTPKYRIFFCPGRFFMGLTHSDLLQNMGNNHVSWNTNTYSKSLRGIRDLPLEVWRQNSYPSKREALRGIRILAPG